LCGDQRHRRRTERAHRPSPVGRVVQHRAGGIAIRCWQCVGRVEILRFWPRATIRHVLIDTSVGICVVSAVVVRHGVPLVYDECRTGTPFSAP
jgi:hypothetical protein